VATYFSYLGDTARGWLNALRTFAANPLPGLFHQAEQRRLARQAWYKRSPGLFTLALIISLGITAAQIGVIIRLANLGNDASTAHFAVNIILGTSLLIVGFALYCLLWLLARCFTMAQFALGFLEMEPRRRIYGSLDDLLATTRLSHQEVIAGATGYCLRLVLPPLAGLALASCLYVLLHRYLGGLLGSALAGAVDWRAMEALSTLVQAVGTGLIVLVCGIFATCLLSLLLISLSLTPRTGMMATIGATAQVLMQLALLAGAFWLAFGLSYSSYDSDLLADNPLHPLWVALEVILVVGLLMYLARRANWVRAAQGYALPLVYAAVVVVIFGAEIIGTADYGYLGNIYVDALWALQALSLISPVMLSSSPEVLSSYQIWRLVLLIGAQLVLIVVCAEFARDALRRRAWGGAKP